MSLVLSGLIAPHDVYDYHPHFSGEETEKAGALLKAT